MLLAPLVQDRKGEHQQVLEELRAPGIRARAHRRRGARAGQTPALDKRRKHTIEVVVDRFRVRPDIEQRLAESFETALGSRRRHRRAMASARTSRERPSWCSPPLRLPGLRLQRWPSWSRACSPSTIPRAPVPVATGWACSSSSTRSASSAPAISACRRARSAAGTGATPITISCCRRSRAHYGFDLETPFRDLPERRGG